MDIIQQLTAVNPMGFYDLAPLCQAHKVNLAIDNMGGDSDGQGYAVMVVTPATDPDAHFDGEQLDSGYEGAPPGPADVGRFLVQRKVAAVFCQATELAYSVADYVKLLEDMSFDSEEG